MKFPKCFACLFSSLFVSFDTRENVAYWIGCEPNLLLIYTLHPKLRRAGICLTFCARHRSGTKNISNARLELKCSQCIKDAFRVLSYFNIEITCLDERRSVFDFFLLDQLKDLGRLCFNRKDPAGKLISLEAIEFLVIKSVLNEKAYIFFESVFFIYTNHLGTAKSMFSRDSSWAHTAECHSRRHYPQYHASRVSLWRQRVPLFLCFDCTVIEDAR
uniref:Bm9043 n=1 Tax=Brugia malayi TaxID=6279 RepID=A0A1I9G0L7_BRUMA|nr:Bm9043 [Brugia malayi]